MNVVATAPMPGMQDCEPPLAGAIVIRSGMGNLLCSGLLCSDVQGSDTPRS